MNHRSYPACNQNCRSASVQDNIRNAVKNYFKKMPPGKILDIPAGSGWLLSCLNSEWEYYPADLYTSIPSANFQKTDLNQTWPYTAQQFDYIACLEGLEHVENPLHTLEEASRLLKPQGKLLISTPNPLNIKSRKLYRWKGTFSGFPHVTCWPAAGSHLHLQPINLSFLMLFAEKAGLRFEALHPVQIKPKMYRFAISCLLTQLYTYFKSLTQTPAMKYRMKLINSPNLLLNDGMVVSFEKL